VAVRPRASMYSDLWRRTATQRNMPHKSSTDILRPSTYDDAVCVNAAVEINVLDYNVAVRQRTSPYAV